MAESGKFQAPKFHFEIEEDQPNLDHRKKLKLYSSASSLSSIISAESQYSFAGTTNELVSHLRSKQDSIQKETFTRLCNQYLNVRDQVTDLFVDFRTGLKLIKLLQKLSNKTVARPARGTMSIHYMQNLSACVTFLIEHKVYLNKASISAENIAEGDERRTLGMVFMIFLRFQLAGTDLGSQDYKGKKSALLIWCQRQTDGYSEVSMKNFTTSWKDGLAFNALIHHFRSDLIQYDKLDRSDPVACLANAFDVAHKSLDVPPLLDPEDVVQYADERSMFLYICSLYQYFNQGGKKTQGVRKVQVVVRRALEFMRDCNEYVRKAKELMKWIEVQESIFRNIEYFKDSEIEELASLLDAHKAYLNNEKKERLNQMSELFEIYTELLIRANAYNFTPFQAPPELIPQEIDFRFGELTKYEHTYRLNLFLCIRQLKEMQRSVKRFDKRAKLLTEQLEERKTEIPALPSEDEATCRSQIAKLAGLFSFFETSIDRLTLLDNNLATLKKFRYRSIQQKIQNKDEITSSYSKAKLEIESKKSLFAVSMQYHKMKEMYYIFSPRFKLIKDTFTKAKKEGSDIFELQEDPIAAIIEIQVNAEVIDSTISEIIEHTSTLNRITQSLEGKTDLLDLLHTLLTQYKQLRDEVKPLKELLMELIQIARNLTEIRSPVQINRIVFTFSNDELDSLKTQFDQINKPTSIREIERFLSTLRTIELNAFTIQNRVESLLLDIEGSDSLITKSAEIIGKCKSLEKSCLEEGWLSSLLGELDSVVTLLTGVKGKVNHMNRQVNNAGKKLNQTDIDNLTEYQEDLSDIPETLSRILGGYSNPTVALPPCPDFSNESEARIRTQKIEHILAYTLPIIAQLLISADTAQSNRETEPESINGCLTGKLELLDKMQTETPNPEEVKDQENTLNEISSSLEHFEQYSSPDEETAALLPKLKKSLFEKQNKNRNALNRLNLISVLDGGRDYLQIKSKEFDKIADDPSMQTESNFKVLQSELTVFQDKLTRDVESELPKLNQKSRTECELFKSVFDTDCSSLVDKISELSKKAKDRERSKDLIGEADLFLKLCDSLTSPIVLEELSKDPISTLELDDQVKNQISTEKVVSEKTPVYDQLINELYHSGFSDGREKGKEVQKKWQSLQQTIENNSKLSAFITNFLSLMKELSHFQSLVDRLNLIEIPQIQNELSQKTPDYEEILVLSAKTSTLLSLIKYISHCFNTNGIPPQISKYKTECSNLIGTDQTTRFLTPKITHLETSIEDALNRITDLDALGRCWLKYYLIDRRAKLESNWAKENQTQISGFEKRKLFELKSWADSLKQNWIKENSSPDQYESFPEELNAQIISTLQDTENTLDDFITQVSENLSKFDSEKDPKDPKEAKSAKVFEGKLIDLETELGAVESGDSLVNNNNQISYLSGLPNLLTKLENEISNRCPESPLLAKIPDLQRQINEVNLKLKSRNNSFNLSNQIETHLERNRETNKLLENSIPIEKCNLHQLECSKCKQEIMLIETKPCDKFLSEISENPTPENQETTFQSKLETLKDSNEKLVGKLNDRRQKIPKREEILDSESKLDEGLESLNDIEFILSNNPSLKELSVLEEFPRTIEEFVAGCDQNLELDAKRTNIVRKSKSLSEHLKIQKNEFILENRDKIIILGSIEYFQNWLQQQLDIFNETAKEVSPQHTTITFLKYIEYFLIEIAPKLYNSLLKDCPSNVHLSEELKDIWPINKMDISNSVIRMEFSLSIVLFLLYIEESANKFYKIKDKIPNSETLKQNLPLTKIIPMLCERSLTTAGYIYSENSKKYQTLTSTQLTPEQSAQLSAGMQTLSQSYHDLVENCRCILLIAKSVVVRDPIVKKVKQLKKGENELKEKIEKISKEDSLPDNHNELEALIVSQESACKDLPMLLAASQNPENSLGLADIQEIHFDAITATKSLGIAKDNWSKTKAMFSRKETLKFFDEKEAECTLRGVKMDAIEDNAVLDAWELWCDQSIERINNMEIKQPEVTLLDDDISELESSLALSEGYSISDFTIADPASFDLDVGLQRTFDEYKYNLLHSITEDESETVTVISLQTETEPTVPIPEDNNNNIIDDNNIEIVETTDQEFIENIEKSEEIRIEEPINKFDFSKLANVVYTQEPIDGDPARPSPVHRVWDTGYSDDSDDSTSVIESLVLSGDATYVKEGDEFEGMSLVDEVVTVERVRVVETTFNFDALLAGDSGSTTDDTTSRETVDSEKQSKSFDAGVKPKRHVSFTREDVVIGFTNYENPTPMTIASGRQTRMQGFLSRKQELISENRKPLKRQWKDMFVVLKSNRLEFYKDPIDLAANYILYPELVLAGALCESPTDYTKKEFVFRVVSASGASYLFQTRDSECLSNWVSRIRDTISLSTSGHFIIDSEEVVVEEKDETKSKSKLQKFFPKK